MIDVHAHLDDEQFDGDLDEVIGRAKQAGVEGIIVVAQHLDRQQKVLDLVEKHPKFLFAALGMHPVQRNYVSVKESEFNEAEGLIRSSKGNICAIGEVGLDFSPRFLTNGDEDKKHQREVFKREIEIANEFGIALNVHSRSAGRPVIDWLLEHKANSALLHAFSGNVKSAKKAIDAGYYFSIPPSFSLNTEREALVQTVPIEQLCLESDSPALGPNREERNEPANIRISAEFIARVKKVPVEEVIRITTENARRLFKLI